ncbi:MAG: LysR family transcriptional regulator [Microbacteriaceae bacterium]|jgi:DNA-binding transcriptional LysR family regulator|nr:LysR family transcriptional regulator [Microbacteriaceae bacterium]MCI1207531.1 LysR family transcriptional regulator [Microbacteriaceae bacterium]
MSSPHVLSLSLHLRDLEYFAALAESGGFGLTAEAFGVSQPTISAAVGRLEHAFATPLVVRNHARRPVTLTTEGRQLLVHTHKVLAEIRAAHRELQVLRTGTVRIGLPPILGRRFFPELAEELERMGLFESLSIVQDGSAALRSLLAEGALDLSILGSLDALASDEFSVTDLGSVPFRVIVPDRHPLAGRAAVAFRELADEQFILLSEGYVHPAAFGRLCESAAVHPTVMNRVADVDLVKELVRRGVGIGFLAQSAIGADEPGLHALPLTDPVQPRFRIFLARLRDHLLSGNGELILQAVHRVFAVA